MPPSRQKPSLEKLFWNQNLGENQSRIDRFKDGSLTLKATKKLQDSRIIKIWYHKKLQHYPIESESIPNWSQRNKHRQMIQSAKNSLNSLRANCSRRWWKRKIILCMSHGYAKMRAGLRLLTSQLLKAWPIVPSRTLILITPGWRMRTTSTPLSELPASRTPTTTPTHSRSENSMSQTPQRETKMQTWASILIR